MLSVVMLAHEDEDQLPETLDKATKVADELIVVDSYSEDSTADIAEEYGAEVHQVEWQGYAETWQYAIDQATGDWILMLGSDEVLSNEAIDQILEINNKGGEYDGYKIYSINYIARRKIPHWCRYAPRLFKRSKGRMSNDEVHESIQLDGKWGRIEGPLHHYTLESMSEHISKLDEYTQLGADDFEEKPNFNDLYLLPLWVLGWNLFRKGLILDGTDGLYISIMSAVDSFVTAYRATLKFEGVENY